MHPPLYQPHPLCGEEVLEFTECHKNNPVAKFFNACGLLEREVRGGVGGGVGGAGWGCVVPRPPSSPPPHPPPSPRTQMNRCFKSEKELRRKLNKQFTPAQMPVLKTRDTTPGQE